MDLDKWVLQRRQRIPFEKIRFDENAAEGQARPLDMSLVKVRQEDIRNNPPHGAVEPIVWLDSPGGRYVPLTLQHTTRALMLERDRLQGRQELGEHLQVVKATVVRTDTPLRVRQLIAGGDQNKQEATFGVKLSRFAQIFLEEKQNRAVLARCVDAISRTGYRRPSTKVFPVPL